MKNTPNKNKIINDPVHGFITIPSGLIYDLVEHPTFQRLRYIKQLGLTEYVYPGSTHSRFQHSLGALHLMSQALQTLRMKGVDISSQEEEAAMAAILLHDIGHGPFSHALEYSLIESVSHEELSLFLMDNLNREFGGKLDLAIDIFRGKYKRKFFHDLVSSQIDMDRLDYLMRDSFFSGVIEGSVGAGRIIKMLNVCDNRLVVDDKGIYSIEKFLIARRLMYWQVYMHKTVVSAEKLLIKIIERVKFLVNKGIEVESSAGLDYFFGKGKKFLSSEKIILNNELAQNYLMLDDNEMICSIRMWRSSKDKVLSDLSRRLLSRDLFAIELSNIPFDATRIEELNVLARDLMNLSEQDLEYYVYAGDVSNMTYAPTAPRVRILTKTGDLKEITQVSDMLNHEALSREVTKHYICYPKELRDK